MTRSRPPARFIAFLLTVAFGQGASAVPTLTGPVVAHVDHESARIWVRPEGTGIVWHDKPNKEKDGWETYAHEREALFRFIGERKIAGVVLLGGDVHASLRLEHPTLTSTWIRMDGTRLHEHVLTTDP